MTSFFISKKQSSYKVYKQKKDKQPDILLNMLQKSNKQKQNAVFLNNKSLDFQLNQAIKRHMIQKRLNNISNLSFCKKNQKEKTIISQPVKFVQKTWIPPNEVKKTLRKFSPKRWEAQTTNIEQKSLEEVKMSKIIRTMNLNKKMKYLGDFMQSQFDKPKRKLLSFLNIPKSKQSKLDYLQKKYKKLAGTKKPKLFVLNSTLHQKNSFYNPLQEDHNFNFMIKSNDDDLIPILIKTLSDQEKFTFTSFTKFYQIFVWQTATKQQLTKFATKILIGEQQQIPISHISTRIDFLCSKLNLQGLLQGMNNFSQVIKKLLFGSEFCFALENQFYLTRKVLIESLQRNQECTSIFVNVFYA